MSTGPEDDLGQSEAQRSRTLSWGEWFEAVAKRLLIVAIVVVGVLALQWLLRG